MAVTTDTIRRSAAPTASRELTVHTEPEPGTIAHDLRPLLVELLGHQPAVRVVLWDGSAFGRADPVGTVTARSPEALRHMLWAPGELGLARAYVTGALDVEGDVLRVLEVLRDAPVRSTGRAARIRSAGRVAQAARAVGALGRRLPPPPEEARPRGVAPLQGAGRRRRSATTTTSATSSTSSCSARP